MMFPLLILWASCLLPFSASAPAIIPGLSIPPIAQAAPALIKSSLAQPQCQTNAECLRSHLPPLKPRALWQVTKSERRLIARHPTVSPVPGPCKVVLKVKQLDGECLDLGYIKFTGTQLDPTFDSPQVGFTKEQATVFVFPTNPLLGARSMQNIGFGSGVLAGEIINDIIDWDASPPRGSGVYTEGSLVNMRYGTASIPIDQSPRFAPFRAPRSTSLFGYSPIHNEFSMIWLNSDSKDPENPAPREVPLEFYCDYSGCTSQRVGDWPISGFQLSRISWEIVL